MQRVKNAIGVGRVIAMHRDAVRDISSRKTHVARVGSNKGEALKTINGHLVLGVFRSGRGAVKGFPAEGVGARDKTSMISATVIGVNFLLISTSFEILGSHQ